MAYRKASEEPKAVALGSTDFWAAVQSGGDVQISVGDILTYLRTVLEISDMQDLQGALDAIAATAAAGDAALQTDVNTRATKTELSTALGGLDGSVKAKLDALTSDVTARDTAVRAAFAAADTQVKTDIKAVTDTLATKTALTQAQTDINARTDGIATTIRGEFKAKDDALQADINTRATKAQLGTVAGLNTGTGAGNVPVLGSDSKLDVSVLPAVAITDTFPVGSQAAMLALVAERGDIAIRSDLNRCYVLKAEPASTLANWSELLTPTDAVLAVAGLTGSITAAALKVALGIAIGDVAGLQSALDTKFDKSGGSVSGSLTVTNDLKSDRLTYTRATALANSTDLNTVVSAGFYDGTTLVNAPDATSWWYVEVQRHSGTASYVTQTATRLNGTPEVYVRNATSNTWSGWYRVWTALNFDPASKASLNASVSFSALTVSARPSWAGLTPWDNGNFDPATKHPLNGTIAQDASANEQSPFRFGYTDRTVYQYGNSTAVGVYDSKAGGVWSYEIATRKFKVLDKEVWTTGNFDPSTKANAMGQAFTGAISATDVSVPRSANSGGVGMTAGGPGNTGYIGFWPAGTGARHGYIGSSDGVNITLAAEVGRFNFAGNEPAVNGAKIFHAGNFSPDTKATLGANVTFSRIVISENGTGTALQLGDDAQMGDVNVENTIGVRGMNDVKQAFFQMGTGGARVGFDSANWIMTGGGNLYIQPGAGGSYGVWHAGNFNPANYAANGTPASFTSLQLSGKQVQLYSDSGVENLVVRTGNATTGWRYSVFDQTGEFRTGTVRAGTITSTGDVVVGDGQTSSKILMRDSDEGDRSVHNNSGAIGFLGKDGGWKFQVKDDGSLWCAQFGDINARIEKRAQEFADDRSGYRVAKTGDTMSGDLTVEKTEPGVWLTYPNVTRKRMFIGNDGVWRLQDQGGQDHFRITGDGVVWTQQLGDLNTRIEDRAKAFAEDRAGQRVAKTGDTITGLLEIRKDYPTLRLHYPNQRWFDIQVREWGGISFLSNDGEEKFQFKNDGSLWTKQFGDLNSRIEDRTAVRRDEAINSANSYYEARMPIRGNVGNRQDMAGSLSVTNSLDIVRGNVLRARWIVDGSANIILQNGDNDDNYFYVNTAGAIWTKQFGDLNNRIETRAADFANDRLTTATNRINNKSFRLTFAGDLGNDWNVDQGNFVEPYGGAVMTTRRTVSSANGGVANAYRWRYCQMSDSNGNWYTCGYA